MYVAIIQSFPVPVLGSAGDRLVITAYCSPLPRVLIARIIASLYAIVPDSLLSRGSALTRPYRPYLAYLCWAPVA